MVEFFPDTSTEEIQADIAAAGGKAYPRKSLPRHVAYVVLQNARDAEKLAAQDSVAFISAAPESIVQDQPTHYCPGLMGAYGPVGNFVADYVVLGDGWDGPGLNSIALTYKFINSTPDLTTTQQRAELRRAMDTWSKYAQIAWTETATSALTRSFDISFAAGDHGDGNNFDGPSGILAHCFFPNPPNSETIAGDAHFDEAETWRVGSDIDIFSVALHEFGHGLGLNHSDDTSAVMYAFYQIVDDLRSDDINGIRSLYAATSNTYTLSVNDVTVTEGATGTTQNATFTVSLSAAKSSSVTVNYTTLGATASAGSDYTEKSGTLTFAPGVTSQTVNVAVLGDAAAEGHEDFRLNLSAASGAVITDTQGIGTITDDDVAIPANDPYASAFVLTGSTGNTTGTNVLATIQSAEPDINTGTGRTVWWKWTAPATGTATFGTIGSNFDTVLDVYTGSTITSLTLVASNDDTGSVAQSQVSFPTTAGTVYYVRVGGFNSDSGSIALQWSSTASLALSINDVSLVEGASGATGTMNFTVTLSAASSSTVTVNYVTANATATAGSDYTAKTGTLTFAPGVTSQTIGVSITGDAVVEPNETLQVNLSGAVGATISDAQGIGTITNDDLPSLSINDVSVTEGASGTTKTAAFTVTLSAASSSSVTVNYATANGTATAGSDYIAKTGTLTFAAGTTSQTVSVTITGDATNEPNETFQLNLSGASGATIADAQGIGTITNDDAPALSVNDVSVTEGAAATTKTLDFTVSLSPASTSSVTVNYATANATATAGSDYTAKTGSLTFAAGITSQTVSVTITGDALVEPNETLQLNLSGASGASITDAQGIGTITNDDSTAFSVNDVTVTEGAASTTKTANFTVSISAPSSSSITVNYATANSTATAGSDYVAKSGTLTFAAGTTSQTVSVTVNGDATVEPNETFQLNLSSAVGASISDSQGIGTITNDDSTALSVNDVVVSEGAAATTKNLTFTVTLSAPSSTNVTANYATANGSATAGSDYTATSGTLTFTPGVTSQTVNVVVTGDATVEPHETFQLNLSGAVGASIADAQGIGTIINDDGTGAFTVSDVSVIEGGAGTTKNASFTVALSAAGTSNITVNYATADATATAGNDYVAKTGTLTFTPGTISQVVNVTVNGDATIEPNETFQLNLSGAVGASITDAQGIGTITNDDTTALSVNDVSVSEGAASTTKTANFTVALSAPSASSVTVNYATANATATAGSDYVAKSGTLTFAAGTTSQTVSVTVNGDATVEPNETFQLNLSSAVGASISDAQGIGTITNDDSTALSVNDVVVSEGAAATTKNLTFTVALSAPSSTNVTVNYATANGSATAGSDYTATSGTLTFAPGVTSQTVNVTIQGDATVEPHETLQLNLSGAVGASISDSQGIGTIANDDGAGTISVNDVAVTEGAAGATKNASFIISLSSVSATNVTVNYATANATATAGSDYTATTGTLTFVPGSITQTVNVPVVGDATVEPHETFQLNLTSPVGATIADAQGIGTINNDDGAGSLTISDVTVTEGAASTTKTANFTVSLSATGTSNITVNYATADGTATAGSDYTAKTGTLTFSPGSTTQTVSVTILGDATVEPNETLVVNLSGAVGATISDTQGVGTISNDD